MVDVINIKSLNLKQLTPTNKDSDGAIYLIIGPSGSGKSTIAKSILYEKSSLIPVAVAISETETVNKCYTNHIHPLFIYDELKDSIITDIMNRQTLALENKLENPFLTVVVDDCMNKKTNMSEDVFQSFFKTSRHYKLLGIITCQYSLDLSPNLREQCAGFFILKTDNDKNRRKIYDNYASIIPTYDMFNSIMDTVTADRGALFINCRSTSDNWNDKIFWYKAEQLPYDWIAYSKDVERFCSDRYDTHINNRKVEKILSQYNNKNKKQDNKKFSSYV